MDIAFVVEAAVPYLAKGAGAFSKTAGEMTAKKVGELCQAVKSKFKGDSYAEKTLARAEEHPESENRRAALKEVLIEKMNEDTNFAGEIFRIIETQINEKDKNSITVIAKNHSIAFGVLKEGNTVNIRDK